VRVKDFKEDLGAGVGVVPVKPSRCGWTYRTVERRTGNREQLKLAMTRNQIPLAPERVRTCQVAQGMSMDSCKMYLPKPGWLQDDDYWMHLYVMLSRVRTSYGLVAYGLPEKEWFERGPPKWVVSGMRKLRAKARQCRALVATARAYYGLPEKSDLEFLQAPLLWTRRRWARSSMYLTRGPRRFCSC
jgi:hypothetical protein